MIYVIKKLTKEEKANYIEEILESQFMKRFEKLKEETEKQKMDDSFLQCCNDFFKTCHEQQRKEQMRSISFLNFNYLRYAMLQEELELQLAAYGQDYYLEKETSCYQIWKPSHWNRFLKEDLKEIETKEKRTMIGFTFFDYQEAKENYCNIYCFLLGKYCSQMAEQIVTLESYQKLDKTEDCKLVFGGYMDQGTVIYPLPTEENSTN